MKVKLHKKNYSTLLNQKKFVTYWIEKLDRETSGRKISLLMDCTGCDLSNMDMELIMYIITLFKYYFPFALGYIYIYQMPWLFKAFWKIVKIRLPTKTTRIFKFINKSSIKNYIALDQLPLYLGGSCTLDYAIMQSDSKQSEKKLNFLCSELRSSCYHFGSHTSIAFNLMVDLSAFIHQEIECYMGQPLSPDIVQVPPKLAESMQKDEDFDPLFQPPECALSSPSQPGKSS
ncbi:motile sperm domain-containing protein 2-like [Tachypleus tridentatus]|uniref:motile sperm domain-containing protein 2-like n=1 Tax=Tachypleus tridentatus TaxID=6853 RepID=UPI003FD6B438